MLNRRRRSRPPHILVMVHAVRDDQEKRAYTLLLDRLRADGHELSVITWDRGKSVIDLSRLGPVGDIEDVNRWRLPIWLAKTPLRPLARQLRHARMRWWWRRANHPTSVLVLGLIRPEMRHYLPPGAHVGVLLGLRPAEDPESLVDTLAIADTVLALDEAAADRCGAVQPDVDVLVLDDLWRRLHWSLHLQLPPIEAPARAGVPEGAAFVLGIGPIDWGGGPDQFIAMAARVHRAAPTRQVVFGWIGGNPQGPDHYPYRFDVDRLGLADRFQWLGERDDFFEFVRRADVVVLCGRQRPTIPFDPTTTWFVDEDRRVVLPFTTHPFTPLPDPFAALVQVTETPVARFDLGASEGLTLGQGTAVPYPDNAALAAAVNATLDHCGPTIVGRALDHLLGTPT